MAAPEPASSVPPDDAEALAAARAEFWLRWRGELPSYACAREEAKRMATARHVPRPVPDDGPQDGRNPETTVSEAEKCSPRAGADRAGYGSGTGATLSAQGRSLKARVTALIGRELKRCEARLGPLAWSEHEQWVTGYVVVSARQWMARQAQEGKL